MNGATRALVLTALLILVGCGGGSASSLGGVSQPLPPAVFELDEPYGGAGDVITFRATGVNAVPANSEVTFVDLSGTIELRGTIISIIDLGTQPGHGVIRLVSVIVPGGVRSGFVTLLSNGTSRSSFFDASPEIVGVAVGDSGLLGAVSREPNGSLFPDTVLLYGYNLSPASGTGVTQIQIQVGTATPVTIPATQFGPPPGATFTIPPGLEMIRVPLAGLAPPQCQTTPLTIVCRSFIQPGVLLETAKVSIPLAGIPLGGQPADAEIPGYFTGAKIPAGTRTGDVPIDFGFLMTPAGARFDVVVEYEDPTLPPADPFALCSPAPDSPSGDRIPGTRAEHPGVGLIGPGAPHRFVWDSLADLPGSMGAVGTRIRLRAVGPVPVTAISCPTGEWITPGLIIDNSTPSTPRSGMLVEEFEDISHLDPTGGNAIWSFGELAAPFGGGNPAPQWGTGTQSVVFAAGRSYRIDTDAVTMTDVTDDPVLVDMLPSNPGALLDEFHVQGLFINATATVEVIGSAPLVIRCAGIGSAVFLACIIDGDLQLDGSPGVAATATVRGVGGAGGPGGGAGGDGGFIEVTPTGDDVVSLDPGSDGVPVGGTAGHSTTFTIFGGGSSVPIAGPGGGGGGSIAGNPGLISANPATNPIAIAGSGGPARGDAALTLAAGGSGGGGGGACAVRLTSPPGLLPKHGGGGGGGGGSIQIVVRGSAEFRGQITVRGGAGASAVPGSSQPGGGGGGSGGGIALRTTGTLELFGTASLDAAGGAGDITIPGAHQGGDGAPGRIRLESNGTLMLPPNLTVGTLTSGPFLAAGRSISFARSRPYRMITESGIAVGRPATFDPAVILPSLGVPSGSTHVIALYEGAAPSPGDPFEPGAFSPPVGDPTLIENAEFIRVRWFLYTQPGSQVAVDRWELPFTFP